MRRSSSFALGREKIIFQSIRHTREPTHFFPIIKYISQLDELDTENVEPTYQVFEMENVWRPDEIIKQDATREELLALTTEEKDHQIKVPKVL